MMPFLDKNENKKYGKIQKVCYMSNLHTTILLYRVILCMYDNNCRVFFVEFSVEVDDYFLESYIQIHTHFPSVYAVIKESIIKIQILIRVA